VRLFFAINLAGELRERLYRDAASLRAAAPGIVWVQAGLLHFTVKFLGDVAEEAVDGILASVRPAVARHRIFALHLAGVGGFPNFRRLHVVWIGVTDDRSVGAVARDVENACEAHGIPRDERPFSAHLTLGRVKRALPGGELRALERVAARLTSDAVVPVTTVDLMVSERTAQGPTHRTVASLPLGA
jgi:2'-5' RNA ligase